jgi:hypothetical protein
MAKDYMLRVRLDVEEVENWKRGAKRSGVTLSEWIRRMCNSSAVAAASPASVTPVAVVERAPAGKKCKHGIGWPHCRRCYGNLGG